MELSLVANFDELRRCQDVLTDGTAEVGKSMQTYIISKYQMQLAIFFVISYETWY